MVGMSKSLVAYDLYIHVQLSGMIPLYRYRHHTDVWYEAVNHDILAMTETINAWLALTFNAQPTAAEVT